MYTPEGRSKHAKARKEWVAWLEQYGPARFYDAFLRIAQDAKSTCTRCGQAVFLDIREGGGITDWRTEDGDYGCFGRAVGGSHTPERKS